MNLKSAAKALDGVEYGQEEKPELFAQMKEDGIVAVFGAGDDLMEFRGACYDELEAYEGTTAFFTKDGLVENECEDDGCPYYAKLEQNGMSVHAIWAPENIDTSWAYKTEIPHETFNILENGATYCQGIVFRLSDCVVA